MKQCCGILFTTGLTMLLSLLLWAFLDSLW
jgi:hypothetical protein